MAFSRLVFTALFLSVSCYASQAQVPVFLWGDLVDTSMKANPLVRITTSAFRTILDKELTNDPFTVVFVDETLSTEDLTRKNLGGESSFPYLQANLESSQYLPSVESPLLAFNEITDPTEIVRNVLTEDKLITEIESEAPKFMFIYLKDAREGESRADMLLRHNDFMQETFAKLKDNHKRVIAFYTGHYPSWVIPHPHDRVRRQTEANGNAQDFRLDGLHLYAKRIELREGNNTISLSGNPVAHTEFSSNTTIPTMNTTLTFGDNNFTINFREKAGYWYLDYVTLNPGTANEEELLPQVDVFAITGFSYRCGPGIVFSATNVTRTLVLESMQIQPYFKSTNESVAFGDAFDCVGFFTAPIWSGIMVTFILLAITFVGIMMMMDIRTMDRFDDPKGKTITINALD